MYFLMSHAASLSTALTSCFGEPVAEDGIWLMQPPIGPERRSHIRVPVPLHESFGHLGPVRIPLGKS
jgi:hypothetical protein